MRTYKRNSSLHIIVMLITGLTCTGVLANSHLWRINEIYSNDDGSIQFIEMQEINGADGEFNLIGRWFQTNSFQYDFPNNLPGLTAYKKFLMATQGFADLPGAPAPDFIIPDNFIDPDGDLLVYFIYDSFELPPGLLPTDGVNSLDRYDLSISVNTPTNFAGDTGSIVVPPPTCTLVVTPTYSAVTGLDLAFQLGTVNPAHWNVWLVVQNNTYQLRSLDIPGIDPPVPTNVSLPGLPPLGSIGALTTLTTTDGIICSDWKTVETAP